MSRAKDIQIQLKCQQLSDSSLQKMTRGLADTLRRQNLGTVNLSERDGGTGQKGDPVTLGTIILTLIGSHGVAVALAEVLKSYLIREKTIEVEVSRADGTKVKLKASDLDDQKIQQATQAVKGLLET